MKRVVLIFLAVVLLSGSLFVASCIPKKVVAPDVVVWHSLTPAVEALSKEHVEKSFRKLYPDITVKMEHISDLRTRLLAAIPAKMGPDLFIWAHDWTGEFSKAGYILPIDEFMTPELKAKYTDFAYEACTYDGKTWALPFAGETVALIYNKAMVKDPPENMTELIAQMKAHHKPQERKYGTAYPIDPYFVSAWVHAFGGWYFRDSDKTAGVNTEGALKGLKYLVDTFKPYMGPDPAGDLQRGVFHAGMAPFLIDGPWGIPAVEKAGLDFGVTLLPLISEIITMPKPFTGVQVIWVAQGVKDKEKAFKFMQWFTTDLAHITERATKFRYIPVLKEVLEVKEVKDNPVIMAFAEQMKYGILMPRGPEMMLTWGPFGDALTAFWLEPAKLKVLFDTAQKDIEEKIKKAQ